MCYNYFSDISLRNLFAITRPYNLKLHIMDSLSDSDLSEGMRELIGRGFAISRGRERVIPEARQSGEPRAQVRDLDVSHVQRPLTLSVSAGVASTHGLTPATLETVTAAGRNTGTTEPRGS